MGRVKVTYADGTVEWKSTGQITGKAKLKRRRKAPREVRNARAAAHAMDRDFDRRVEREA